MLREKRGVVVDNVSISIISTAFMKQEQNAIKKGTFREQEEFLTSKI